MFYVRRGNEIDNYMNSVASLFNVGFASADVIELEKSYDIYIDVPGVSKNAIDIKYEDSNLSVSAKRDFDLKNNKVLKRERTTGNITRSFSIIDGNPNTIKAKLEDGVLHITIDKLCKERNKKIIQID